ncbi:hypothetical protein ARMGADRAFT_1170069 [Armillaria gallica]|uniref:Uncharacterized protein n=1 Tax=Armillaria gallica TaxID=47427 RepID=A0A2H3D810_ARMGA|nr:hypothetical protein ARMGADRAFT_1170069 [Armillaria gallica]
MPALNACLQVARLAEATGDSVPYLESVAKVAVLVFKLLDQKAKNKESAKELCESMANTILVINDLVRMQEGTSCYIEICGEMEGYLQRMVQDIEDIKHKHHGLKGFFCVDDFRDAIQSYRRRVDDLKTDFLIHSVGDCNSKVTQIHFLLMNATPQAAMRHSEDSKEFVFRIPKKAVAITALFF